MIIIPLMILNIICGSLMDALRDNCINRKPDISYMRYHIPKWVSLFGQQCLIILLAIKANIVPLQVESICIGIVYAIVASLLWKYFYKSFGD